MNDTLRRNAQQHGAENNNISLMTSDSPKGRCIPGVADFAQASAERVRFVFADGKARKRWCGQMPHAIGRLGKAVGKRCEMTLNGNCQLEEEAPTSQSAW